MFFRKSDLFEGTAWYYARHRPECPPEIIDVLVRRFYLRADTAVLDLGCGTGQLSIPFARRGLHVCAVDPDVDMLGEGIRSEQRSGVSGIAWMRGDDQNIKQLRLPPLKLCTMGASFHWMDREKVLKDLDALIVDEGGVAVLSGNSVWSDHADSCSGHGNVDWEAIAKDVIAEFLGPERRAGAGVYSHPAERHESVLSRSPFKNVEKLGFTARRNMTIEEIVGLQLSTSYACPVQLGKQMDAFVARLSERLLELHPSGSFSGESVTEVLIATR